ncbi:MAG: hypothetical protein JWR18_975 [Segetibacter sp.]|jgi:predicted RNA-binding Zn-ribbon protein involved in translation (DUF1610 family)|nr:hypothetical protein [Segetibacter sp.]
MKRLIILVMLLVSGTVIFAQKTNQTKHKKADKSAGSARYTCPMHPEVSSKKAGKCGKCGMSLVKAKPVAYTCPMDPEVKSNKPGKCPKCGMDLEVVKASKQSS